jgi:xylose dehydrogenase (NAD/NADP)
MKKRLRWGVLGASGIARTAVVPAIQRGHCGEVKAIASRDLTKAHHFAQALGIPRIAVSYDALLADPEIDAVYIPLPNSLHAEWTIRAAAAGKAVLCDKPLAVSATEVSRQIEACERHRVVLMEGFMYRFHPQTHRVQQLVASGAIGQVQEVQAHLSVNIMRNSDRGNIRFNPNLGGGALLDMGCYTVSVARMAFGAEPQRAFAQMQVDATLGVDIGFAGVLEFADGFATIGCAFTADGQGRYSIIGTEGTIEVPRGIIPGLGTRNPQGVVVIVDSDGNRYEESFAPVDQYELMVDAFAEAVLESRPVPLPPRDSLATARVLDALALSAQKGVVEAV